MFIYTATTPDGLKTVSRKSSRVYTRAIASRRVGHSTWIISVFCGTPEGAEKRLRSLQSFYKQHVEWQIVECVGVQE
jgi:hypothetical protein